MDQVLHTSVTLCRFIRDEASKPQCADFNNTTWLEYKQGTKVLVQYLLLTRKNADCASLFTQDCLNHTQQHTAYFNSTLNTIVIIHGYRAIGSKPSWVSGLAQALLQQEDVNVVVVDWIYGASFAYNLVVENYKEVSVQISVLINQLTVRELYSIFFLLLLLFISFNPLMCNMGLDPAGPMFKNADPFDRLDPSDAMFVEAIHTDSDYFGISIPVGHVDFFLNGGMDQTGCARSRFASMYGYVICDHMRALHVYMSALNGTCALTGIPCSSYEEFLDGRCLFYICVFFMPGLLKNSGITVSPLPKHEKVYLLTTSETPFCAHHILIELKVNRLEKTAEVQVNLISMNGAETEKNLRLQTDEMIYKAVIGHPECLCKIDSIQLKNIGARFYRQGNIHFEYICISEILNMRGSPLCVENINIGRGTPWSYDFVQVC
uniref:Phospholipase A1 member A n=1 Tax=Astyanax mexicanus TaxID=7994 RepID=A0A8B9H5Q8_ASTMX